MDFDDSKHVATSDLRPYSQESLLIDALPEMAGERILCTSPGLAQFAGAAARALPRASVFVTYLDQYRAQLAWETWRSGPNNLQLECAVDLAAGDADVVAFPFSASGEAELTREFIQAGHQRLKLGGKMYAATDRPTDGWLDAQMRTVFRRLERRKFALGVLYVGTKSEPLKRVRDFSCEFAFRDRGRLIRAIRRPAVFSHRHIDTGARRLIDAMEIEPGSRVLDIGCGAGVVALAAAFRAEDVAVHAADSNARAVECTQRGAAMNGLKNLTTELNAGGNYAGSGTYDLALANPPYYSGFRIARHFLTAGREALRAGGKILVVTKRPDWYQENMTEWFDDVSLIQRKGYYLACGVRRD
jgi:hypothetical protein